MVVLVFFIYNLVEKISLFNNIVGVRKLVFFFVWIEMGW